MYNHSIRITTLAACALWAATGLARADYADIWKDTSGKFRATVKENDGTSPRDTYNGTDYFDAINAGISGLTPNRTSKEIVFIKTNGASGSSGNTLKYISLASYTILDFQGHTIDVNDNYKMVVGIRGYNDNHIEIKNVYITGAPRYGIWLSSCNNAILSGINMHFNSITSGIGIRADNSTGTTESLVWGFQLQGTNTFRGMGTNNHGVETLEVGYASKSGQTYSGYARIDNITSTDIGGCSVLLNTSRNVDVGNVTGTRCSPSSGYASFRLANAAGPSIHVDKVKADDCGRGLFTTTGSYGLWCNKVELNNSFYEGILLQAFDPNLQGGRVGHWDQASYVYNSGKEGVRNDQNQTRTDFYNLTLRSNGETTPGYHYGIRETSGSGSNHFYNCDARNNGTGASNNVVLGPGSTFTGWK